MFTFSSGVLRGYVNGVPWWPLPLTFTGTETLPLADVWTLHRFGSFKTASFKNIDDVRLYNRVLSDADVQLCTAGTLH